MNLSDLTHLKEKVDLGIDVHLSDLEGDFLMSEAKKISPHGDFFYKGCIECATHLVKFVFDNQEKKKK